MIALVTIGQAPRDDVVASMFNERPPARLLQAGALDDLADTTIDAMQEVPTDYPLITRLADGREVVVGKPTLLPLLQAAIDRMSGRGADVICVLCTGEFPTLTSTSRLVFPDRLLSHAVEALLPTGRLGVLAPHEGQCDHMLAKWSTPTREVEIRVASPYTQQASIADAAAGLAAAGVDFIIMDCMGYDRVML